MIMSQFCREFEIVLERPAGSLAGTELLADIEQWDSLAKLGFLAMVDSRCGISIRAQDVDACMNVADLFRLLDPVPSR